MQIWDNNLPRPEELVKILERILGNVGSDEDMAVLQKVLSILPEQNPVHLGN
ncbi:MAG: hypothetical protein RMY29_004845 [Nostoc sp. CreGUA01]|nr:hypothetical protein [Nostoc sp. CreGUA01]